jgi:hypothetical protein
MKKRNKEKRKKQKDETAKEWKKRSNKYANKIEINNKSFEK